MPPYDESPVIANLTWEPKQDIRRAAFGSDNFPVTWADDDNLYTAFGDGLGFEPQRTDKLSLGFAYISGGPTDFVGTNIISPDEILGDGPGIPKSSSMLMVDGVLYMWQRNVIPSPPRSIGCRIGWSTDYGRNWSWTDWVMTDFGFCAFINYGKNYEHARDDYVYTVSHNHPSAYRSAPFFILMRVPKESIRELDQYEFFTGLTDNDEPTWSANVEDREPVFDRPSDGYARRSSISYNHILGRYFWWQGFNNSDDVRDLGGIGIYDAPEPWGPWTQVYYNLEWDVGPGDLGSFATKWISDDGLTMYLVFSGYDAFSVRKATLELRVSPTAIPTATPTFTPTSTSVPTTLPTFTPTPSPTLTPTPTFTPTPTVTPTPTSTMDPNEPSTPQPPSTSTLTPTPTFSPTPTLTPTPTGTPSILWDTDNDGIADIYEDPNGNGIIDDDDTDGDLLQNFRDADDDGDGIPTLIEISAPNGQADRNIDLDGDTVPDYLDADDDGDGTPTSVEGLTDRNSNGIPDYLDADAVAVAFIPLVIETEPLPTPDTTLSISVRVGAFADDAEEDKDQRMNIESPELEIGNGTTAGVRFVDLPLGQGSEIIAASLVFEADEDSEGEASFMIRGEATNSAGEFGRGRNDIFFRRRTTAFTSWDNIPQWVKYGASNESPDIAAIVQEIVDRPGWQAGNAMAFFVSGTGLRVAEAFDDDFFLAPVLKVTYRN